MNDDRLESLKLLTELRANYNCYDAKEEPYYRALSIALASIENEDWLEAKTIAARKSYEHEYSLRKELEVKIAKLEKTIETLKQKHDID